MTIEIAHNSAKYIIGFLFVLLGIVIFLLPFANMEWITITEKFSTYPFLIFGGILFLYGSYILYKSLHSEYLVTETNVEFCNTCSSIQCFTDENRTSIINKFKPHMYMPLEFNFINLVSNVYGEINAKNTACDTNVFPYVEKMEFVRDYGYKFDGKNMLSIHSKNYFPSGKEARTFIFAVNPTNKPSPSQEHPDTCNPMFFFSYGKRKTHQCGDGYTNHDKSFGVFWGDPQPTNKPDNNYLGCKVRLFFYCEHGIEDRTSNNCDSIGLCDIEELNTWYIFAVTYNGNQIKFYKNGSLIHQGSYDLPTSETVYLNIGGFVRHDEEGAIIARGIGYSMHGFIREFMMFRRVLGDNEIKELTTSINNLLLV